MKVLRAGYIALAQKLQEAADLTASDVRSRLSDQLGDMHRGTGHYASYLDHSGDDSEGDVIYSVDGNTVKAPYEISGGDGTAAKTFIHSDKATNVVPRTVYEPEADQDELDQYAAMVEAGLYTRTKICSECIPLVERTIPKSERDAADTGDFAGKGKSFPILKAEDVEAALHSLGRAGSDNYSTDVIRKKIIAIAKRKGFPLPKSAQDASQQESRGAPAATGATGTLKIVETTKRPSDAALDLIESAAGTEMEIKLIAPGKGSSAFYTPEALKQAATDKIFDTGTHVYINHATAAEESARPEGDWHKLVGALKTPAYWSESHKQGPGLYAKAAFASDMAPLIKEKAPYTGMSIRANGDALQEAGRVVTREGVPVLAKFTSAESVDIVTRAGAGGMILAEAARHQADPTQQEGSMTLQEAQRLIQAEVAPLRQRALKGDAREEATRILEAVSLPEPAKARIIERCLVDIPTDGKELDTTKFREAVVREAKAEGQYLAQITGAGNVFGMGIANEPPPDPKLIEARAAAVKVQEAETEAVFAELMGNPVAAKLAAQGRAA